MGNEELKSGSEERKPCPFCGSGVVCIRLVSGAKVFYCKNSKDCGAVVSFENQACSNPWNRRAGDTE